MTRAALLLALLAGCGRPAPEPAPAPADRPWTLTDFEGVAAGRGCAGLPRLGSPAFERMVDPSVLATIDPGGAFEARASALVRYQQAIGGLARRYGVCGPPDAVLATGTAQLEVFVHLLPLVEQQLAATPATDPTRATREGGLEQMKAGIVGMATGAALVVRGSDFTSPLPGVGRRLGVALARASQHLPAGTLYAAIGNLDVPPEGDDDPERRAIRVELRDGLRAP